SLANVFGGNGVFAIGGARAGAINSGAESCDADGINPCVDVGLLFREHAPALFLIEEDDCAAGKALAPGRRGGDEGVGLTQMLRVNDGFQLREETPVEQDEESESGRLHRGAMSSPGIRGRSGRIVEPVPSVGKRLTQSLESGVAGILVAVEAEVGLLSRGSGENEGNARCGRE